LNRRLANREDFSISSRPTPSDQPAQPIARPSCGTCAAEDQSRVGQEDAVSVGHGQAQSGRTIRVGLGGTYGVNSDENLPPERVYLELEDTTNPAAGIRAGRIRPHLPSVPRRSSCASSSRRGIHPGATRIRFCRSSRDGRLRNVRRTAPRRIELFADEPEVSERMHCSTAKFSPTSWPRRLLASRCTKAERAVMRWLYPRIGRLSHAKPPKSASSSTRKAPRSPRPPLRREELTAGLSNETYLVTHP